MKRLFLLLPLLLLYGCIANDGLGSDALAETNVWNLSRLTLGMKQAEVLRIMRQPYKQQTFNMDDAIFDVWFYVTNPSVLGQTRMVPLNLTPLTFKNGQLIGWGYTYYNYLAKRKEAASRPLLPPAPPIEKIVQPKEDINLEKVLQPSTKQQQPQQQPPQSKKGPNWGPIESPNQQQPKGQSGPGQQQTPAQNPQSSKQPAQPSQKGPDWGPVGPQQQNPPPKGQSGPGQQQTPAQNPQSSKQPAQPSEKGPNWGPLGPPQEEQQPQSPAGSAKPPVSMSRKPKQQDQADPSDSQPSKENEGNKIPLKDKDNEMLEEESEQNFDQT